MEKKRVRLVTETISVPDWVAEKLIEEGLQKTELNVLVHKGDYSYSALFPFSVEVKD